MSQSPLRVLAWPGFDNQTGNPYNRLLYEAVEAYGVEVHDWSLQRALRGGYDLWHVHWPDDFLSEPSPAWAWSMVAAELVLMAAARVRETRIVWTVHDLGPHESHHPRLETLFWKVFPGLVDGFIALSDHARAEAEHRLPRLRRVPGAVVPHGHYRPAYPDPEGRGDARRELGLSEDATVLAYVGRIRPYKNVPALVEAFRHWDDENARLLVAGNPASDGQERAVRTAGRRDDRVTLDLRFVPEEEMTRVLAAADLVVLPYEDILHSGSALLALSFDRPVLVPGRGAMAELRMQVGERWVRTYDGPITPAVLRHAAGWARETERPSRAPLDDLAWPRLARQTVELYRRTLEG